MPGVFAIAGLTAPLEAFQYVAAVGVSPQEAVVTVAPYDGTGPPPVLGDLTFGTDEDGPLTLRGCRLAHFQEAVDATGRTWTLRYKDRRWRWADGFPVDGAFNQLDDHAKLVPWTVRSPHQLAVLLLTVMGEAPPPGGWDFAGVLPPGLAAAADPARGVPPPGPLDVAVDPAEDYLRLGDNTAQTGTNPHTEWLALPAAAALAEVCDRYGAVVVWNPADDSTRLERLGVGLGPPTAAGRLVAGGPGVDPLVLPEKVVVVGAPVRFQLRLVFRPVGEDWDGSFRPLDDLSYAPGIEGDTDRWAKSGAHTAVGVKPTLQLDFFQARELALRSLYADFQLVNRDPDATAIEGAKIPVPGLHLFSPGDPADADGICRIDNRFRVILRDTRPEQVAPRPGDENRLDADTGKPFAAEVYDGYSKDRPPVSFASIQRADRGSRAYGVWGNIAGVDPWNCTAANSAVYVPFRIADPLRQVIRYARKLYRLAGGPPMTAAEIAAFVGPVGSGRTARPLRPPGPPLVVETGCLVLDAATHTPVRFRYELPLGGPGPARVVVRDDVQAEVIGEYSPSHICTGFRFVDADAAGRAAYYARAEAHAYQAVGSRTLQLVGLLPVRLSGVVRQVGWRMTAAGFDTTCSANSEYSPAVPAYPQRRRAENLPPDPVRAANNLATRNGPLAPPPRNAAKPGGG